VAELEVVKLLARGVDAWNAGRHHGLRAWDQQEGRRRPELDLTHVEIRNADLRGVDLRHLDLDGATLARVDLRDATFRAARVNGVTMESCDLAGVNLDEAELKGADMTRVRLRRASMRAVHAREWKVRHSDLTGARFNNAYFEGVHFYNCDMTETDTSDISVDDGFLRRVIVEPRRVAELQRQGFRTQALNEPYMDEHVDFASFSISAPEQDFGIIVHDGMRYPISAGRYDFFISHASVDKEHVARPLAEKLVARDFRVWLDDDRLTAGDDLSESIDFGIQSSLFGVVVLRDGFFDRRWTTREFDTLVSNKKRIFLLLHGVDPEDLEQMRPGLSDEAIALTTDRGLDRVANDLERAVRRPPHHLS
jgi:hypothetical protein